MILVKGGTYGAQNIANRSGITGVTIRPAPGESAVFTQEFNIKTHDLVIDGGDQTGVNEPDRFQVNGDQDGSDMGLDFGWGNNSPAVKNNVVEDVHARNVYYDDDSSGNNFRYGEAGPSNLGGKNLCSDLVQSGDAQFVVEYNLVHDNLDTGCGGAHIDAMDLNPADSPQSVVRGNRIWWCGTQCVFTGDPGSLLVENNMIEETAACGSGCDAPQELALMGNTVVRWNTIEGDTGYGCESCSPGRAGNANVTHNLFLSSQGCDTDNGGIVVVACDSNVFVRDPGGTNSKVCTPKLVSGLYTDIDRQAQYELASDDTCARGIAGADIGALPPPPPPPTTTQVTTTAPTTTTTPPPAGCDAACEQAYKDQIATLTQERDAARADAAAKQAKIDKALADLSG